MKEQLPIPGWLPLMSKHLKLLEACSTEPQVIVAASLAPRHHLESTGLICCLASQLLSADRAYIATEKGLRTLRVQKMMKELGITRQRRPLARFPDNDLVELTALLENLVENHRRAITATATSL
jgi:hypothetical protein